MITLALGLLQPGQPCAFTFQGMADKPAAVTFFEVEKGLISRIDLCMPELYVL